MLKHLKIAVLAALIPLVGFVLAVFVLYMSNGQVGVDTDFSESACLATPPEPLGASLTLKLATFNIQDLYIVGKDRPARMRHIARVLAELDPDIVGFQEAFIRKDRDLLIESLSASRLRHHVYYPSGTAGSGLLISSAWPIREVYFARFTHSGPAWRIWEGDFWGGKGVALARIESPAGMLDLYNTHAQAGYGRAEYREVRRRQMEELAHFMNQSRTGTAPAFLVGDMNCGIGAVDYETAVNDADLIRTMIIASGIDHVFAARDERYEFETLDTIPIWERITEGGRTFELSDHHGFMSVIRITPVVGDTPDAMDEDANAQTEGE